MAIFRRRSQPVPPQNVRIEHADGTVTPLELAYLGRFDDRHVWATVQPVHRWGVLDRIEVSMLPAQTEIRVTSIPGDAR